METEQKEKTATNDEEKKDQLTSTEEQLKKALEELEAEKEARKKERETLSSEYAQKLRDLILSQRGGSDNGDGSENKPPAEKVIERINSRLK